MVLPFFRNFIFFLAIMAIDLEDITRTVFHNALGAYLTRSGKISRIPAGFLLDPLHFPAVAPLPGTTTVNTLQIRIGNGFVVLVQFVSHGLRFPEFKNR
ncbi:Hypothetical protein GbCGDNIH3_1525 [Granulibacter bethesdensis]|uniref:Uncharacterized protein n=1 Tax=Granulibacter bethesdensis TaxID=364410 RepID=A0AAN0REA8_9PROT|nr:Hypothetical protein GbCGDNIH3_1525 [Granulibacter bethesdensis]